MVQHVDIMVGARCEVESQEVGLHKRGTVRYVDEPKFSKGIWVGVEYDEPFGKNDGSYVLSLHLFGNTDHGYEQSARGTIFHMQTKIWCFCTT